MKPVFRALTAILLVVVGGAKASDLPPCPDGVSPRFEDHAVVPDAASPRPVLLLNNRFSRMFRTRLREGLREGVVDLAGHYVVVTFGCGAGCLYGGFVDVRTGQATALPFALETFTLFGVEEPLVHRADSRLFIMRGTVGENETQPTERFYIWTGRRLEPLCQRSGPMNLGAATAPSVA